MRGILFWLSFALGLTGCTDDPEVILSDEEKEQVIREVFEKFKSCRDKGSSAFECRQYISEAACRYNAIDDFMEVDEFLIYPKIYDKIISDPSWENLGYASNCDALVGAHKKVMDGNAVVAIDTEDRNKMVVVLLQGAMAQSSKWGCMVPRCAAFFTTGPEPFISKTLNYAFSKADGVQLFVKTK